jgi:hypothetical protein
MRIAEVQAQKRANQHVVADAGDTAAIVALAA